MDRRNTLVSLAVLVICGGILTVFTDVELALVHWVNCGSLSTGAAHRSGTCR